MLISLWRRLRKSDLTSFQGKALLRSRRPSFRPELESLEDRTVPTSLVYGVLPPPPASVMASGTGSDQHPMRSQPDSVAVNQMKVTVAENSTKSVIDLCPLFAQSSGVRPEEGVQLSLLGNTNPALVNSELSEGELTLTYAPSRSGTATITVGAITADGSCLRENILVTVFPSHTIFSVSALLPANQRIAMSSNTSRAA